MEGGQSEKARMQKERCLAGALIQGLGLKLGVRVQGLGFRVQGSGCRV